MSLRSIEDAADINARENLMPHGIDYEPPAVQTLIASNSEQIILQGFNHQLGQGMQGQGSAGGPSSTEDTNTRHYTDTHGCGEKMSESGMSYEPPTQ